MPRRPRILSISFSEYGSDARVLRQLSVLSEFGDVTTLGYGARPEGASEHLQVPTSQPSLPQSLRGVIMLALQRFEQVELAAPAVASAVQLLRGREFDLVVANEARALPLAHAVANGAPVWGDMHEWAPEERTHVLSWRILVAPFMRYVCAKYLPQTAAVTTVNESIAKLYRQQFHTNVDVVRNAIAHQDLRPSPGQEGRVRLVHSGAAVPGRNIEALIDAVGALDDRFSLDLFLVGARDGGRYLNELHGRAKGASRIIFHEAVPPADLPRVLNEFDVGVFSLPPRTLNHRYMLPNKFFDFVQARLAIVFSPAVETDALIREFGLGLVANGFGAEELADSLKELSADAIRKFKDNAHRAAESLSSETDEATQRRLVSKLLAAGAIPNRD